MRIQKRLLLSILPVVFISIFTITGVAIHISSNIIEKQVKNNTTLLSHSYSNQLNSKIENIKMASRDIASAIVTAVNVETVLIDARKRYPELNRIFYTSTNGFIKDMSPYNKNQLSESFYQDKNWNKAIKNNQIYLSDPIDFMGENVIMVYTPVFIDYVISEEPKVVGVVVLAIPSSYIFSDVKNIIYGKSGSLFVTNNYGYYIYHNDESKIMKKKFIDTSNSSELISIDDSMKRLESGIGSFYIGSDKNFISFSPVESAKWTLSLIGDYSEFTSQFRPIIIMGLIILVLSIIFTSVMIFIIVRNVSRPLLQLTDVVEKISSGDFSLRSKIENKNEIGQLSKRFDMMVDKLEDFNATLEKEVLCRTQELTVANEELITMNESMEVMNEELTATNEALDSSAREMEAMNEELRVGNESLEEVNEELIQTVEELEITKNALWSEMELAQKLQTILLPEEPKIDGFEIAAFMTTTSSVGGDYYDVINIDGKDWFLIGDVSGHGVTAGLIMMMVQTSIHIALSQSPDSTPEQLLLVINKTINCNIRKLGGNRYMTLTVFACLDNNKISFAGAHLPVIIYRHSTDSIEIIETNGAWIGLVNDISNLNTNGEFLFNKEDIMLLYTDGISEGLTADGKLFSQNGLVELFKNSLHLSPQEICRVIKDNSEKLILDDDITAMVIKKV